MKRALLVFVVMTILSSCYSSKMVSKEITKDSDLAFFGKKATYQFAPFTVIETFLNDSTLHWEMTNSKGIVTASVFEKVSYKSLQIHNYLFSPMNFQGTPYLSINCP